VTVTSVDNDHSLRSGFKLGHRDGATQAEPQLGCPPFTRKIGMELPICKARDLPPPPPLPFPDASGRRPPPLAVSHSLQLALAGPPGGAVAVHSGAAARGGARPGCRRHCQWQPEPASELPVPRLASAM
jgi:hypothetical protein